MNEEHAIQQLRITGWPGRLPHPAFSRLYSHALDGDGVIVGQLRGDEAGPDADDTPSASSIRAPAVRQAHEVADAGEIYLELVDLDLDDTQAIVGFVNRHGVLGISYHDYALVRHLPGFQEEIRPALEASWPAGRTKGLEGRLHRGVMLVETLAEFRLGAACIRDLTRAWQRLDAGEASSRPGSPWESFTARHRVEPTWRDLTTPPAQASEAESYLVTMIDAGLEPFHPRLFNARYGELHARSVLYGPHTLYSTCCLELFNHILEHATYRHCGNDACQRIFVRQTGRADHGQHRSAGIKYCSKHCARAQAQREYRNRERAKQRSTNPRPVKKTDQSNPK